jgi:hypothetical protein
VVVLAASVSGTETGPDAQVTVSGSPVTAVFDDSSQLVAPVTVADSITDPPALVRDEGLAVKPEIVGFAEEVDGTAAPATPGIPAIGMVTTVPTRRMAAPTPNN